MSALTGGWLSAVVVAVCVAASACAASTESPRSSSRATEDAGRQAFAPAGTAEIPACTSYVDPTGGGEGSAASPLTTIAAAVDAATNGDVICVAEGTYSGEELTPGEKFFTLAGEFQSGSGFTVRDSATYVSRVEGVGTGSFYRADDPAPAEGELVAIDGFDISGYAQAISRVTYFTGRIDITNNVFHDNDCNDPNLIGAAFSLSNVTATIEGNVFTNNSCGRGGAGAVDDTLDRNDVTFANNVVTDNSGTQPDSSHGGAVYLFGNRLAITSNAFSGNEVTGWGAGLFVGANNGGGQHTTADLAWNVYRDNRAGINGGGFFCDDSATCRSEHEIYDGNCGGNLYVDSGPEGAGPTVGSFDHMTNVNAKEVGCNGPGAGFTMDHANGAPDEYTIANSIFYGNGTDVVASCGADACDAVTVSIAHTMVQTEYADNGVALSFGEGIVGPEDPLFVDPSNGDLHLQSTSGHWTATGFVSDDASSPALGKGSDGGELGAYGDSDEAARTG